MLTRLLFRRLPTLEQGPVRTLSGLGGGGGGANLNCISSMGFDTCGWAQQHMLIVFSVDAEHMVRPDTSRYRDRSHRLHHEVFVLPVAATVWQLTRNQG